MPVTTTYSNPPAHTHIPVGFALNYAVFAAPLAWNVQLLVGYALAAHACFPHNVPLAVPVWGGLWWILIAVNVASIAAASIAFLLAVGQWRAWRGADLRHVGQRRNRYIAQWAILVSALFWIAVVFTVVMLFIEPVCSR